MRSEKLQRQSMLEIVRPAPSKYCIALMSLFICGCSPTNLPQNYQLSTELMVTYNRSCKTCHEIPATGAPQTESRAQWAARYSQGIEVLVTNTIEGKGNMPPLGQCFDCTREQFEQLILFMASEQNKIGVEKE
jgi:hypothetical protein